MLRRQRIKGLNRRVFYRELKRVLNDEASKSLKDNFEAYVNDYEYHSDINGCYGWYELKASETKKGFAQEVRTN